MTADHATTDFRTPTSGWVWIMHETTGVRVRELPNSHSATRGTLSTGAYWATNQTRGEFVDPGHPYRASSFWVLVEDAPSDDPDEPVSGWISSAFLDYPAPGILVER